MEATIGWSEFALKHSQPGTGNSYCLLEPDQVIALVVRHWDKRRPGAGEQDLTRKVLVPVPQIFAADKQPQFFCPPRIPLQIGMPVRAEVVARQEGEAPYVQTYITPEDAARYNFEEVSAHNIQVVCYSADALQENDGQRSTDCDWEIVTILCDTGEPEPMVPLAMARNTLEKAGGTKSSYTAKEFAEAIWYWANRGLRVKEPS